MSSLDLGKATRSMGEFSVNVSLGHKIEKGKFVGCVKGVMLTGNAFTALNNITAISKELESISDPFAWISGLFIYV